MSEKNSHKDEMINHSPVIHIRNIPKKMDEAFVGFLAVPFGLVDKIIFMNAGQALIQMKNIEDAIEMVNYYRIFIPRFYGNNFFIQFSSHRNLSTTVTDVDLMNDINEMREYYLSNCYRNSTKNTGNKILRIVIDNAPQFNFDHLIYYKIFSRFGQILRVLSSEKDGKHYGLVEFLNPVSAQVAQVQLNGASIFKDDIMEIEFSTKSGPLIVQKQSDNDRDYVLNPLSDKELSELHDPDFDFPLFSNRNTNKSVAIFNKDICEKKKILNFLSETSETIGPNMSPSMAVAVTSLLLAYNESGCNNLLPTSNISGDQSTSSTCNLSDDSDCNVVMVSNLNPEKSNPDALFKLFGVYGEVVIVKVMMNKRSKALVQYVNHNVAKTAVSLLNDIPLWGKHIRVRISSTKVIKLDVVNPDLGLTKDYSAPKYEKWRRIYRNHTLHISAPSTRLHLVSIPGSVGESQLRELISSRGYGIRNFQMLPTFQKMAVVELCSLEEAVHCLIDLHNHQWDENHSLRVSFANKAPSMSPGRYDRGYNKCS